MCAERITFSARTIPESARVFVGQLAREASGGVFDVAIAARVWGTSPEATRTRIRGLVARGWVKRLRRGLFLVLPLEISAGEGDVVEDTWVLAESAFAPCYVGGWSAAHHWGLTEQLFRSTFVVTSRSVRSSNVKIAESEFRVARVPAHRVAHASVLWRGSVRVHVSDRELTIVDALADPSWVGGFRHLVEVVRAYRRSDAWKPARLIARLAELDRRAAYKRLGYIAEMLSPVPEEIVDVCLAHRSAGVIALDPAVDERGHILSRWGVRVNVSLGDLQGSE